MMVDEIAIEIQDLVSNDEDDDIRHILIKAYRLDAPEDLPDEGTEYQVVRTELGSATLHMSKEDFDLYAWDELDSGLSELGSVVDRHNLHNNGQVIALSELKVEKEFRGLGIGRHLLDVVINYSRIYASGIILKAEGEKPAYRKRLIEFYTQYGFKVVKRNYMFLDLSRAM